MTAPQGLHRLKQQQQRSATTTDQGTSTATNKREACRHDQSQSLRSNPKSRTRRTMHKRAAAVVYRVESKKAKVSIYVRYSPI
mmetsp:Transcript_5754/g.6602  ORF Transcript_5754/g.6602 Transcript_5754/m.6602 type:complete len:83 (+) Transcript_5754:408-656(+)